MEAPIELLTSRPAVVGTGTVLRYLPRQARRLIGAWCFLDVFAGGGSIGVGPHPHIGIQTATWLTEGRSVHRDSIGSLSIVEPGQLSFMTAGAGIAHAEEPPPGEGDAVGAQLWVALPNSVRATPPAYAAFARIPPIDLDGASATLFIGSFAGVDAAPETATPLLGAQLDLPPGASTTIEIDSGFEHGLVALSGSAVVEQGATLAAGTGAFVPAGRRAVRLRSTGGARLLLIGGEPFDEQIVMWWNLVARNEDEITTARNDWEAGRRFGDVHGSALERIPAPPLPPGRLRPRAALPATEA